MVAAYGTIERYDAAGNRLSRAITAGGTTVETYAYDAFSHRLLSVVDGGTTRSLRRRCQRDQRRSPLLPIAPRSAQTRSH